MATYPLSLSADITMNRDKTEVAKASSTLVDLFNKRSRNVPQEVIDIDASPSNAVEHFRL